MKEKRTSKNQTRKTKGKKRTYWVQQPNRRYWTWKTAEWKLSKKRNIHICVCVCPNKQTNKKKRNKKNRMWIPVWSCTLTRRPLADNWRLKMKAPTQLDGSRRREKLPALTAQQRPPPARANKRRTPPAKSIFSHSHPSSLPLVSAEISKSNQIVVFHLFVLLALSWLQPPIFYQSII